MIAIGLKKWGHLFVCSVGFSSTAFGLGCQFLFGLAWGVSIIAGPMRIDFRVAGYDDNEE